MIIDTCTLSAAERLAMAEHNRRVGDEIRRMTSAAAAAAGQTTALTATEAREDSANTNAAAAKTGAQLEAEYQGDPKLQAEFMSVANYVAFRKAEAAGKIKIASGRVVR